MSNSTRNVQYTVIVFWTKIRVYELNACWFIHIMQDGLAGDLDVAPYAGSPVCGQPLVWGRLPCMRVAPTHEVGPPKCRQSPGHMSLPPICGRPPPSACWRSSRMSLPIQMYDESELIVHHVWLVSIWPTGSPVLTSSCRIIGCAEDALEKRFHWANILPVLRICILIVIPKQIAGKFGSGSESNFCSFSLILP